MTDFPRNTFDLAGLQASLCRIENCFLCKRWHRNRLRIAEFSPNSVLSDHDISNHVHSWVAPYITTSMLRANNVPWHVSPAQPAILPLFTNIWAGVQDLTLHSVTPSGEVDKIHCMFCLDEEGDQVNERVVLRFVECRGLSHLACTEEWLRKRGTGCGTSCCICPTETALDALYRPPRDPSPQTAECSEETLATVRHDRVVSKDITQSWIDPTWTRESPQPGGTRWRRRTSMAPGATHRPGRSARLQRESLVSLVTESFHAPSTRRRLARLGWVSKWLEELV
ncbi:uncharacterized protein N7484_005314 [Penicillium longicatenatum]|uniref:uncharacterized protein n=1 Tax=Penicillium longicatenatum TaxID=1561947 RepID=UPI002547DFDE|nr:uncharacterized protein N7484_005314 [Penicillium longicatenatum]KAJ5651591.1 hypothetical protein N7484_005314 [Penicillium longicatenatum]